MFAFYDDQIQDMPGADGEMAMSICDTDGSGSSSTTTTTTGTTSTTTTTTTTNKANGGGGIMSEITGEAMHV